jgi:hypothetical protein
MRQGNSQIRQPGLICKWNNQERNKNMRMLLLAGLAALVSTSALAIEVRPHRVPTLPTAEWVGYSVSPNGRVFQSQVFDDEMLAKATARVECSSTSLRTCEWLGTIAVSPSSYVVAINCGRKESFIGGSNIDAGAALWMAHNKARSRNWSPANCRQVFESE